MSKYSQAPLPETINQFWTMIWEKDIGVIVALNQVGIGDSPRYWPEKNGATVDYLPIRVKKIETDKLEMSLREIAGASISATTTMTTMKTTKTIIHDLLLRKDGCPKTLELYEFPGWKPEENVPEDVDAFLTLVAHHASAVVQV